mmetsp:Transcript_12514/g.31217  ORF Transcript_12514/g.31217 Transcript_12514/m.31217 type:complete len:283 (+) Transcript_12514:1122-1970(+)
MISSFHARGCALSAGPSSLSASSGWFIDRSSTTDFIHTRSVPARSRAVASSERARSGSLFSDSSLTAASHTCSESGLARKASFRMARAATMSPESHFSLAPMSQRTCAWGQYETALRSSASSDSAVPCAFSCCAARTHTDFFVGKTISACANTARAHSGQPRATKESASSIQIRLRSSSSTFSPIVSRMIACAVRDELAFSAVSASSSHCSRSRLTWWSESDLIDFSMIRSTRSRLPLASSSLAAVIQICGSVGMVSRALLSTLRAFWYVSRRARASHMSTE